MAAKYKDLLGYFRALASEHVEIRHTDIEKHFYRFVVDELISGAMTGLNYPALVLEGYDYSYLDNGGDNVMKDRNGAFMLIGHVSDITDYDAIADQFDSLESIIDDIIVRIRSDKAGRQVPAVRDFDLNKIEVVPIGLSKFGQYGFRVSFAISCGVNNNVNSQKWTS